MIVKQQMYKARIYNGHREHVKEEKKRWITKRSQANARMARANAQRRLLMSIAAYIVRMRQVARKLIAAAVIPIVYK